MSPFELNGRVVASNENFGQIAPVYARSERSKLASDSDTAQIQLIAAAVAVDH